MININKVIIQGNIGKTPEIRTTPKGKELATFDVAVNKTYTKNIKRTKAGTDEENNKDKTKEELQTQQKETKTQWIRVVCWNEHLIPKIKQYLKKGTRVYLEGELNTRSYVDSQGKQCYTTEVWTNKLQFENERE